MSKRRGRITKIWKDELRTCSVLTGVKSYDQGYYNESPAYCGSNGTYAYNFKSEPLIYMKITLYETDIYDRITGTIEIRDACLLANPSWKRISQQRFEKLYNKLDGLKITLDYNPETNVISGLPVDLFAVD